MDTDYDYFEDEKKSQIEFIRELEDYITFKGYRLDDYNFFDIEEFLYECYLNNWDTSKVSSDEIAELKEKFPKEIQIITECINNK